MSHFDSVIVRESSFREYVNYGSEDDWANEMNGLSEYCVLGQKVVRTRVHTPAALGDEVLRMWLNEMMTRRNFYIKI